jgi:LmbE family N-acetylglucosaminyl deacetylase
MIEIGREMGAIPDDEVPDVSETSTFGASDTEVTHRIDVRDVIDAKRASMAAHASQIGETSFWLQMPVEAFAATFGWEWYIDRSVEPGGELVDDVLAGL